MLTQRYVHDLTTLQAMPLKEQEHMMGRTRDDNQEIPGDQRPDTSRT